VTPNLSSRKAKLARPAGPATASAILGRQRPPLANRVERERRIRVAAPHRTEEHGGGSLVCQAVS